MNDDDDEYGLPDGSLEMGNFDSETHDDVDPFEELGIGGNRENIKIENSSKENRNDVLSDLLDGDDSHDEEQFNEQSIDITSEENVVENNESEEHYLMLLKTVWVDGILDPAEVRLLAKKRDELKISFERHLTLVQNLIG
tara:strand:+ start:387 stop:806 length:420 start_codon:yes stop_codon:yes gene_type:complete